MANIDMPLHKIIGYQKVWDAIQLVIIFIIRFVGSIFAWIIKMYCRFSVQCTFSRTIEMMFIICGTVCSWITVLSFNSINLVEDMMNAGFFFKQLSEWYCHYTNCSRLLDLIFSSLGLSVFHKLLVKIIQLSNVILEKQNDFIKR